MSIGQKIREARRLRRLSLQQVAARVGLSAPSLSRIETDKQALDVEILLRLARTLRTNASDLLPLNPDSEMGGRHEMDLILARLSENDRAALWDGLAEEARAGSLRGSLTDERLQEILTRLDFVRDELELLRHDQGESPIGPAELAPEQARDLH